MSELKFNEYWFVLLDRNPEYDRENPEFKELMDGHFAFIDEQLNKGNLYVAIPLESGGIYFFNGKISKEQMEILLQNEISIQKGVFLSSMRRAYVPEHHLFFTLESHKKIQNFHEKRRNQV